MEKTWVNVADATKETGVSKTRIYAAVNSGKVSSQKVSGVTEVCLEEVQAIEDTRGTEGDHRDNAIRVMADYSKEALRLITEPNRLLLAMFQETIRSQRKEIQALSSRLVEMTEQSSKVALERFTVEKESALALAEIEASEKKWNGLFKEVVPLVSYFMAKKETRQALLNMPPEVKEFLVEAIREAEDDEKADSLREFFNSFEDAKKKAVAK
jgi:CRISPR/Cas system CSM-associated protein Csm2 small subunit